MSTVQDVREVEAWDKYAAAMGVAPQHMQITSGRHRRPSEHFLRRVIVACLMLAVAAAGLNTSVVSRDTKPEVPIALGALAPLLLAEPFVPSPPIKDTDTGVLDPHSGSERVKDVPKKTPPPAPVISPIEKAIAYALAQVGDRYVWAAAGPNSFDCSGLVMMAFKQIGINLPHFTGTMMNRGTKVSRAQLKRGDIIFPSSSHVAIYLGNGQQVAASGGKRRVVVQPVYGFYTARRLV